MTQEQILGIQVVPKYLLRSTMGHRTVNIRYRFIFTDFVDRKKNLILKSFGNNENPLRNTNSVFDEYHFIRTFKIATSMAKISASVQAPSVTSANCCIFGGYISSILEAKNKHVIPAKRQCTTH